MKARTFGTDNYFVITYFAKEGRIITEYEVFITPEIAKRAHEMLKEQIGTMTDKGKIIDSFIFLAKQCLFED